MATRRSAARRGGRRYRRTVERLKREERVCWICGLPIDPELKSPHPQSFSADHVQPLALGGALLGPLRASHRLCNMKRGVGSRPETRGDRSADW